MEWSRNHERRYQTLWFKEWGKIPVPLENSEHILMEVLLHLWLERVPSGGEWWWSWERSVKCKMQIERSSSLEFRNNLASLDKEWTWMHKRQHWQDDSAVRAKNSVVWGVTFRDPQDLLLRYQAEQALGRGSWDVVQLWGRIEPYPSSPNQVGGQWQSPDKLYVPKSS